MKKCNYVFLIMDWECQRTRVGTDSGRHKCPSEGLPSPDSRKEERRSFRPEPSVCEFFFFSKCQRTRSADGLGSPQWRSIAPSAWSPASVFFSPKCQRTRVRTDSGRDKCPTEVSTSPDSRMEERRSFLRLPDIFFFFFFSLFVIVKKTVLMTCVSK